MTKSAVAADANVAPPADPATGADPSGSALASALASSTTMSAGGAAAASLPLAGGAPTLVIPPEELRAMLLSLATLMSQPDVQSEIQRGLQAVVKTVRELWEALLPTLRAVGAVLSFVYQALERLPVELQDAVLKLAGRGWFFDPHMPMDQLWETKRLIEAGQLEQADARMAAHFEARLPAIEHALLEALPGRAAILRQAFDAHRRGDYFLSVLAFLAQADGVCATLRKGNFFQGGKDKANISAYVAPFDNNFIDRIAHLALTADLPIRTHRDKRKDDFTGLSRHAVMHGESLDYGTKANSLGALSLLHYVTLSLDLSEGARLAQARQVPLVALAHMADNASRVLAAARLQQQVTPTSPAPGRATAKRKPRPPGSAS